MIELVHFKNFRALRDVELKLERFTVLVGPNASGKTSILEGLHDLSRVAKAPPFMVFKGAHTPKALRSFGVEAPIKMWLGGRWGKVTGSLDVLLWPEESKNAPEVGSRSEWPWRVVASPSNADTPEPVEASSSESRIEMRRMKPPPVYSGDLYDWFLAKKIGSAVFLHFDPAALAEPSYSDAPHPRIEFDGSGLASVLADLALSNPEEFEAFQTAVRTVVPVVEYVRFQRAKVFRTETEFVTIGNESKPFEKQREYWGHELRFDVKGAKGLPAHAMSEGTLLALGLAAALIQPARPQLILIDDLERALHPKAQADLIAQIRNFLDRYRQVQIVATSHSPYLLDHFAPEEVRLMMIGADGAARCAPLTEHPEYEKWKDEMAPGEFWSTVGESWIKDRKPPAHE
jgi:ABC-type branched-subunit amino acid transport system ATPase component